MADLEIKDADHSDLLRASHSSLLEAANSSSFWNEVTLNTFDGFGVSPSAPSLRFARKDQALTT